MPEPLKLKADERRALEALARGEVSAVPGAQMSPVKSNIPKGMTFTLEEALRAVEAAWGVQHLLPHPDNTKSAEDAQAVREFHRAIGKLPPQVAPQGHHWHFIGHGGCDEEVWECRECGGRLVGDYYNANHVLPPAGLLIYSAAERTEKKLTCEERQRDNKKYGWGDKSVWPKKK